MRRFFSSTSTRLNPLQRSRGVYGAGGSVVDSSSSQRKKFTVLDLQRKKQKRIPITMVTAYDASSAQHVEAAGIDMALVGDSAANVIKGLNSTAPMSMEEMLSYAESVARQCMSTMIIGDLPFGSYVNETEAVKNAVLLIKKGCDAVKLEGGRRMVPQVRAIRSCGITVIGHIGLTPQTASDQGGFKSQGRDVRSATEVVEDALAIEEAGAAAVVLEMVTDEVASAVTSVLKIPTIGIGSGPCNGQVLVYHDILGMLRGGHNPKFAKRYAHIAEIATNALRDFGRECVTLEFPRKQHAFPTPPGVADALRTELEKRKLVPAGALARGEPFSSPLRNVCVIGGGAMGSLFSYFLGKQANVVMLSSHKEHVQEIQRAGGIRMAESNAVSPIRAVSDVADVPRALGSSSVDLAIILVKSYETSRACKQATAISSSEGKTILLSLQNGISHADAIYFHMPKNRVILGTTSMASTLTNDTGSFVFGGSGPTTLSPCGWALNNDQISAEEFERGTALSTQVRDLFNACGVETRVALDDNDMRLTVYSKLLVNCVVNPLTALYRVRNGALLTPKYTPLVEGLCAETYSILRSCTSFSMADPLGQIRRVLEATSVNQSSMLSDVLRSVPTEIDVLNGTILKMAKSIGAHAPLTRQIVTKLKRVTGTAYGSGSGSASSLSQRRRAFSTVRVVRSIQDMQNLRRQWFSEGVASVGFVPTMGGLHDGHLGLAEQASLKNDKVVVSIYVNPTQFGPTEDFARYPRNLENDVRLLRERGLSKDLVVFAPENTIYNAQHSTWVLPSEALDTCGEGKQRKGHFRGVATVLVKLFNIVRPDRVYFGQKDGQQCLLVKSIVRDLDIPVDVTIVPTYRDPDGLAMSTRNQYLNPAQRQVAPVLYRALQAARGAFRKGTTTPADLRRVFLDTIADAPIKVQYFNVNGSNGAEIPDEERIQQGPIMIAAAISFPPEHKLRLLDNVMILDE